MRRVLAVAALPWAASRLELATCPECKLGWLCAPSPLACPLPVADASLLPLRCSSTSACRAGARARSSGTQARTRAAAARPPRTAAARTRPAGPVAAPSTARRQSGGWVGPCRFLSVPCQLPQCSLALGRAVPAAGLPRFGLLPVRPPRLPVSPPCCVCMPFYLFTCLPAYLSALLVCLPIHPPTCPAHPAGGAHPGAGAAQAVVPGGGAGRRWRV